MTSTLGLAALLLALSSKASALAAVPATPAPTYETCSASDDYLEGWLGASMSCEEKSQCDATVAATPASLMTLQKMSSVVELPPDCVLAALQSTPKHGPKFAVCAPDRARLGNTRLPRPCLSERYHAYVYSEYVGAMTCAGLDPREMFGLLNAESNFQVNIGSPLGAWGVGQLTPVAITAINSLKRIAPLLDRPECAPFRSALSKPLPARDSCAIIAPPDGPARNLIYSAESYLIFKERATVLASRWKAFAGLSQPDLDKVVFDLTAYSYNGGPAGVSQALAGYFTEHPARVRSYEAFGDSFRQFLAEHFGESIPYYAAKAEVLKAKRAEISAYVRTIRSRTAQIEKKLGTKCSL